LLVLGFGVHPTAAVGTDLLYAALTKSAGTAIHGFNRNIDWRITGLLALGSVPAGGLAVLWVASRGANEANLSHFIALALGVALLLTALATLTRRALQEFAARHAPVSGAGYNRWLTVAAGAVLGVLVAITSVGAGALGMSALLLLHPKIPTARLVGSDIAHSVPLAFIAGFGHWLIGSVQMGLLGNLLIGSLPGIFLGAWLAPRLPDFWLRGALSIVLAVVGGRLIVG